MDGYADNIPNFDDNYEYGDTFFNFDAASSSNVMDMAVMQHTHDAADWIPSIQDSLDYMPSIMGSSDNLTPDSRHGGHASAPTGQAIPGMTVAPYEGETSNTPNHSRTTQPVDFFSYDPGFDNIGEDPYSRNSAPGSYADDQPPAPGPLYDLDAQMAYSEQPEYSGRPAGVSALVAPSPMLDQSE